MKKEEKENLIFKNEVWITINEFPKYEISNFGRVKNNKNRILKIGTHRDGYKQVCLRKNKKTYTRKIHRFVAQAFIPNPNNLPQVNHIDEDKTNNMVDNLEWVTVKENNLYGARAYKASQSCSKPIKVIYRDGTYENWESATIFAKEFKLNRDSIYNAIRNHRTTRNGLVIEYV